MVPETPCEIAPEATMIHHYEVDQKLEQRLQEQFNIDGQYLRKMPESEQKKWYRNVVEAFMAEHKVSPEWPYFRELKKMLDSEKPLSIKWWKAFFCAYLTLLRFYKEAHLHYYKIEHGNRQIKWRL